MYRNKLEVSSLQINMFKYFLILFFLVHYVESNFTANCDKKEVTISYLDIAVEMIEKAKSNIPTCSDAEKSPMDCADILRMGQGNSGVYTIWPMNRLTEDKPLDVYCDMETDGGGWTLMQRRGNYGRPNDYFYKEWKSYKEGFGDIQKDFWLGNDNIFALTNQKSYSVRFDLKDVELNKKYALYDYFWIDDEFNQYTLHIADYSGDAGDSMIAEHNNLKFSTKDVENDNNKDVSCAVAFKGGWWYNSCHSANLNGLYLRGVHKSHADGVNWFSWKFYNESLESTEIKIRPRKFIVRKYFTTTLQ